MKAGPWVSERGRMGPQKLPRGESEPVNVGLGVHSDNRMKLTFAVETSQEQEHVLSP